MARNFICITSSIYCTYRLKLNWRTKPRLSFCKGQLKQENIDAKHQIRRPEIGCKLNNLADLTNLKVTHYPLNSFFLVAILVKWILIYTNLIFI